MSIYNILSPNSLNLFCDSYTVKKIKIANTSDGNNYTQLLQNKNGTIALLSDVVDTQNYYASLTKNSEDQSADISVTTSYQLINIVPDAVSISLLSNFEKVTSGDPLQVTGLKYIGTANKKFRVTFSCSLAGTNILINTIRLYKNGSELNFFANTTTYAIDETNIIILDCMLELAPNDKLELYIKSTSNLTVNIYCPSFQIMAV